MRVAINAWFWDRPDTGSGQYTRQLVEHLVALDPAPDLFLVPSSLQVCRYASLQAGDLAERQTGRLADLQKLHFEQVTFPRAAQKLGADVAHVPYWAPPVLPGVPTVVTIHDLIPLLLREYRGGPLVRAYTALVSTTAPYADLVLTDSEASRQDIITHLGLPAERVRAIPLAADSRYSPLPTPEDAAIRARYALPPRYALYLGGMDVRKNVETVLRAYRWVGPALGEWLPLVVAGQLPQRDSRFAPDPRRQARELALEEGWVHFIGAVEEADKPALYRGATVFLFPSRYEGFGLPPLEALACGTPVVGSDAASIPEVVGNAGVLLDPDDAEGMAGAILQLAQDDAFRAEMSRRALAQAARFSWQRTAQATLDAYRHAAIL